MSACHSNKARFALRRKSQLTQAILLNNYQANRLIPHFPVQKLDLKMQEKEKRRS